MKEIPTTEEIKNFRGGSYVIPKFDVVGNLRTEPILGPDGPLKDEAGKEISKTVEEPGTIADMLECVVMNLPHEKVNTKSIMECTRIMESVVASRERGDGVLLLEDATYDWLIATLKMEDVGVKMFSMSLQNILAALGTELT